MSFCSNCGTKLQEGDVFCGGCGARVNGANGGASQGTQHTAAASINADALNKHSKQTLDIVLGMLTRPVSTIKNLIHTVDQTSTLVVGAVLMLLQGLLSLWTLNQFISMLDKKLIALANSIGSIMGVISGGSGGPMSTGDISELTKEYSQFKKVVKIPYGNAFFHGIILYLIIAGLIFLGVYLAAKLVAKSNIDPLKAGKLAIFATIPTIGAELINILVSYMNSTLGIFILIIGIFVSFAVILLSIKEVVEVEDDKLVFFMSLVIAIVIACSLFAIWKFILSDINSIKNSILKDAAKLFK